MRFLVGGVVRGIMKKKRDRPLALDLLEENLLENLPHLPTTAQNAFFPSCEASICQDPNTAGAPLVSLHRIEDHPRPCFLSSRAGIQPPVLHGKGT